MAIIINIESSGSACSVALSVDGHVEYSAVEREAMHQSTDLAPFVARAMEEAARHEWKPDAVAVSIGPGSYTGLRIGMSLAKGLAFSLDVPLIGVQTLQILAVKAMFSRIDFTGEEILVPMVDARRMEVYTAAYNADLSAIIAPRALIVEPDSFDSLPADRTVIFMGDGAQKTKSVINRDNAVWLDGMLPMAADMAPLSEKAFRENDFMDLAYGVPYYIKDYEAIHGENPLAHLLKMENHECHN